MAPLTASSPWRLLKKPLKLTFGPRSQLGLHRGRLSFLSLSFFLQSLGSGTTTALGHWLSRYSGIVPGFNPLALYSPLGFPDHNAYGSTYCASMDLSGLLMASADAVTVPSLIPISGAKNRFTVRLAATVHESP